MDIGSVIGLVLLVAPSGDSDIKLANPLQDAPAIQVFSASQETELCEALDGWDPALLTISAFSESGDHFLFKNSAITVTDHDGNVDVLVDATIKNSKCKIEIEHGQVEKVIYAK